jgi:hypothetical protein
MRRCCECGEAKPLFDFHKKFDGHVHRCKPCAVKKSREWYFANKDRKRAYDAKRRAEKGHLYRAASKRFRENNPGKKNADTQSRRAMLLGARAAWGDKFLIAEIYDLAALRTKLTGFKWHVDHIIPLHNKLVCGLHVEGNLQVIPWIDNVKKHNRFSLEHNGVR